MFKKILVIFLTLFSVSLFSEKVKDFYIIYSDPSLISVSEFFLNDLSIVLKDVNIRTFLSYESIEDLSKKYKTGFHLSLSSKDTIEVTYFSEGIRKKVKDRLSRNLSVNVIKSLLKLNVPLVKKKILIFDFSDKSKKDEKVEGFSSVFSFNISEILLKSNNFDIELANREFKNDIIKGYDIYIYGFYLKSGDNITVYSYIYDNILNTLKFSFKDSFKFDKKEYVYFLDKISLKVSNAVIKEYPISPPQVIFKEKVVEIEKKEDIKDKKEEKKIDEGLSNFTGFNVEGIKPGFITPKIYGDKGILELGLYYNSYFNGFNSGDFAQYLNMISSASIFFINRWYLGCKIELYYNLNADSYNVRTFFSVGGLVKFTKNLFLSLGISLGYSKDNLSYYYYGNDICLKIVLTESNILSLGIGYNFVTDLSKIYFNDIIKPFLGFSIYF